VKENASFLKCLFQINIPQQTDEVHWLTFSPVEEHFYRRQYRDCVRLSMEVYNRNVKSPDDVLQYECEICCTTLLVLYSKCVVSFILQTCLS
jgi:hypothetical protein